MARRLVQLRQRIPPIVRRNVRRGYRRCALVARCARHRRRNGEQFHPSRESPMSSETQSTERENRLEEKALQGFARGFVWDSFDVADVMYLFDQLKKARTK